ncbi:MAG: hypothetical protein DA329_03015 [Candidatus Nitrosocosmicus sp.]|nr:hypothetical protein [Candidatus Nitrosocosmicus sp.]
MNHGGGECTNLVHELDSITALSGSLSNLTIIDPEILKDYSRLEGYLKDIYGSTHKKEIFLIVTGAKSGVIELLNNKSGEQTSQNAIFEITTKLVSTNVLDEESAVWTTMVWALSLKKLTDDECQQIITAFEVPLYEKKEVQSNVPIVHDPVSNLMFINSCAIKYIHDQGKRLHNEGNYSEAIKCYDRALSINCRDYTILSDKGLSLHNEGNYSEAIKCYDRALSINCQDEFIKRRRNNTMTLLQKQINNIYSPQDKSKRYNSLNSKSKLSNTHLICIMVVVSALSLGIIFYSMSWADNNENSNSLIADQNLDSDGSVLKTNTDSTWITTKNKLDQGLIGEFTESVENQITIAAPSDKGFSGNNSINKGPDIQHSNDIRPSELGTDKVGEIAQRVDNFKLELEKAMESNFN